MLAVVVALLAAFPIWWSFSTSLRPPLDSIVVGGLGVPWLDFTPTLATWREELALPGAPRALRNSAVVAVGSTVLALLLGVPAAYAIARFRFRWLANRTLTLAFVAQRLLPPIAVVIPIYLMMRWAGLLDTVAALILVNTTGSLPLVVVLLRQGFLDTPVSIEEAALVDGAGHLAVFWRIALPLAAPSIAAAGLIVLALSWNEFLFAVALFGDQARTMPIHIAQSIDTRGVEFWTLGVRGMMAMLPPVLLALLAQRWIVRGLTMGSVTS